MSGAQAVGGQDIRLCCLEVGPLGQAQLQVCLSGVIEHGALLPPDSASLCTTVPTPGLFSL